MEAEVSCFEPSWQTLREPPLMIAKIPFDSKNKGQVNIMKDF